jgi:hypothetical protein
MVLERVAENRELLEHLAAAGFNLRHVAYLDAVREYFDRAGRGEKKEYLVAVLSGRLGVSRSSFLRAVRAYSPGLKKCQKLRHDSGLPVVPVRGSQRKFAEKQEK